MTKTKAIKKMNEGEKITHRLFSDDEWMTIDDGALLFDDGLKLNPNHFWQCRTGRTWETGYSIFKPKSETK